jgi:hypothetical protein
MERSFTAKPTLFMSISFIAALAFGCDNGNGGDEDTDADGTPEPDAVEDVAPEPDAEAEDPAESFFEGGFQAFANGWSTSIRAPVEILGNAIVVAEGSVPAVVVRPAVVLAAASFQTHAASDQVCASGAIAALGIGRADGRAVAFMESKISATPFVAAMGVDVILDAIVIGFPRPGDFQDAFPFQSRHLPALVRACAGAAHKTSG